MSVYDKTAARVYAHASTPDDGKPFPVALRNAADAADSAFDTLRFEAQEYGLGVPGDDRAENLIHAMFRILAEANGFDLSAIAETLDATKED